LIHKKSIKFIKKK
jgi:hypothetical protein